MGRRSAPPRTGQPWTGCDSRVAMAHNGRMTQKPVVVKVGGSTLGSHDTALADIAALHAGGNAATEWLKLHGVSSEFVDGLRVTREDAIDVVVAVLAGLVNKQIVAQLRTICLFT